MQREYFLWFLRQNGLLRFPPALEDVITSWLYISSAGKFLSTVDEKGLHAASNPCRETSWGALNYPLTTSVQYREKKMENEHVSSAKQTQLGVSRNGTITEIIRHLINT